MNDQLNITYTLAGAGWADCTLECDGRGVKVSASYLSNALGNLVLSAVAVASGFRVVEFGFDEEPGECRWVIEAVDNNAIRLRVLEFQELWGHEPNERGNPVFETSTTPLLYAKAVHACATAVLEAHGLEGYADKWVEHTFPERELTLLGEAIVEWEK
jgi:hypothetical protein